MYRCVKGSLLALAFFARSGAAQLRDSSVVGIRPNQNPPVILKDPALATVLSVLVTGAGQMYAGKPGKGAMMFAMSAATIAFAIESRRREIRGDAPLLISPALAIAAGVNVWVWSFATAGGDARAYNSRAARSP